MRRPASWLFALLLTPTVASAAARAVAAPPARFPLQLAARATGELVEVDGIAEKAELLAFDDALAVGLLAARDGEEVTVADWPVAPGERADVVLSRFDVYAPGAKIFELGARGIRELPRSPLVFFSGVGADDPATRVMVSVDPGSRELRGMSVFAGTSHQLEPTPASLRAGAGRHLVGPTDFFVDAGVREQLDEWSCGQRQAHRAFDLEHELAGSASGLRGVTAEAISTLHRATIAVDTDNELINNKFGGNVTTATNYIAALFAGMTTIYERDVLVRLQQGTTFLRTAADPYSSTGSTFAKLQEYQNYWIANYAGIDRAAVMMLSARGGSGASGIAWVDVLCSRSNAYSYTQVFLSGTTVTTAETMVVAHEIGHNFGSPHTHCYSTPADHCYNAESGCYAGVRSCPAPTTINGVANVTGTLMSYCHLSGIAGCSTSNVFHPASASLLAPRIQNAVNTCIFPATPPPTVSAVARNSGSTAGGEAVTITGTGFATSGTVAVTFGGTPATGVNVINATTLLAITPARATGRVTVTVTNPDNQAGSRADAYFYAPPPVADSFYTVTPCRVADTRNANGPLGGPALAAGGQRVFALAGTCGVPTTARAVAVNLTVIATSSGVVGAYPGNAFPLGTGVVGFATGQTRSAMAVLPLATDGAGTLGLLNDAAGATHVIVDVTGYWQ